MRKGAGSTNSETGTEVVATMTPGGAPARSSIRAGAHRIDVPPQREWLTAAEAAGEGLPGIASTKRQINRWVNDGIATRKRSGRGGGREFHWTSLPVEARDEYLKRYGVQTIENERAEDSKSRAAQRDLQAEARYLVAKASASFIADFRMEIGKGLIRFCSAYDRKRTKLEPWVYNFVPSVTPQQLRKWARIIKNDGASALADKRGRPEGTGLIEKDADLRAFVVSQYAARPHLTAAQLCDVVKVSLGQEVAKRTMQAFIARLRDKHGPTIKALTNPDQHRSHHKPAFGSLSVAIQRINQRWELDATRADAMCLMPDGSQRRAAITGLIDVYTRRAMVLVSDQPRGIATQALLRRAIMAWGLPEVLKTDNGKEFVNQATLRFCADLGIEVQLSRVFTPEEKGHIERFFGTMNRGLFRMLPGFVGHNITDRKAIESRASFGHRFGINAQLVFETALSPADLQARVDSWLANIYEHTVHSGLGDAPATRALAFADQVRMADERSLDALLLEAPGASGIRVVLKKGIQIGGHWYIAGELGAMMGSRVHVRMDPHDLDRITVFTDDRKNLICVAERADAISNDRRMQIAKTAQAVQQRQLRVIRNAALDVQARHPAAGMADRILGNAQGEGFILRDDSRKAMETAARPTLVAARAALDALDQSKAGPQPQEPTPEETATARAYLADFSDAQADAPQLLQCDGYQRPSFGNDDVGFWLWAETEMARGWVPDVQDAALLAELAASPGFQLQLSTARNRA